MCGPTELQRSCLQVTILIPGHITDTGSVHGCTPMLAHFHMPISKVRMHRSLHNCTYMYSRPIQLFIQLMPATAWQILAAAGLLETQTRHDAIVNPRTVISQYSHLIGYLQLNISFY